MNYSNFDHLACSPVLPEVKDAMESFLNEGLGNPLSRHTMGEKPKVILEESRQTVAKLIGAEPKEIIFTSCGSESNNLAIKGAVIANSKRGKHIIASPIEHHSVLHPLKNLNKQGYEITWLKVDKNGLVDPRQIKKSIRDDTILIVVTSASNEIGTLEPVADIGKIAKDKEILFFTDAVACTGIIPIDVNKLNIDLLSMSGNIFYGPTGTGALYIRKGVKVLPLIEGGIQERGVRAGTHNIAGIAGMGIAAKIAKEKLSEREDLLVALRDELIDNTLDKIQDSHLTGDRKKRLPNHASFCVNLIEGESMLLHLDMEGFAGTSGSTCSSEALKVSHVLESIGIDPVLAQGSVVFTLGVDNNEEDIKRFVGIFPKIVEKLRKMSPLRKGDYECKDCK